MSRLLKKRNKKLGLPPGSLIHIGNFATNKINITLFDYDQKKLIEKKDATLQECLVYLDTPTNTWINITGIHDTDLIAAIVKEFSLHPLMMEDILNSGQRSKLDDYKENIYIVCRILRWNEEKREIEDEQASMIIGKNYLITFLEKESNIFDPVKERLRNPNSKTRTMGPDYLCYGLMDCIVDNYFLILEHFDEEMDLLETELVDNQNPMTLLKIQKTKKEITLLRKVVWPMREVISNFRRIESPLVKDSTKLYVQDVYDHTIQTIDTIESFRDIASGMLDVYLSNLSQRMNEIMKLLTIVATIFVPLTFIASIYGMNFENMPELHWHYGYYTVLLVMALIAISMLYFFHRKRWL